MKMWTHEPPMNTGRLQYAPFCQSLLTNLFSCQSKRGMILTCFVNALHVLVHQECNLSTDSGMLETGLLFLAQETSGKTLFDWHMRHLAISAWTNPMQHYEMHIIGQICRLTLKNPTSPHVNHANATNHRQWKHLGPYTCYQYQMNMVTVSH